MVKITVGPVVGKVTSRSARILLEFDANIIISCRITNYYDEIKTPIILQNIEFQKNRPRAFTIIDLQPDTEYFFSFESNEDDKLIENAHKRTVKIRTFPDHEYGKFRVVALSCNNLAHKGKVDMWSVLYKYVIKDKMNRVHLLLHCGDQIYADDAFQEAKRRLEKDEITEDEIEELYRDCYRRTWNHPPLRKILSRVPNLMILDDHEVRDDFGRLRTTEGDIEDRIEKIARKIYREYERQLYDDIEGKEWGVHEGHFHVLGPIGIAMLDLRIGRKNMEFEFPYLSSDQFNEFKSAVSEGGHFDNTKALLVVTPVPLVFLTKKHTELVADYLQKFKDFKDHWAYKEASKEQLEVIKLLDKWRNSDPSKNRELLVIGGDLHIAGHTSIYRDGKLIFDQITTSAITNILTNIKGLNTILSTALKSQNDLDLGDGYTLKHYKWTARRNFAVIDISTDRNKPTIIEKYIITERFKGRETLQAIDQDEILGGKEAVRCSIL